MMKKTFKTCPSLKIAQRGIILSNFLDCVFEISETHENFLLIDSFVAATVLILFNGRSISNHQNVFITIKS